MVKYKTQTSCRICRAPIRPIIFFGEQPLANDFVKHRSAPLTMMHCTDCGLWQLEEVVSPEVLYGDYAYVAGSGGMQRAMFADLAAQAKERCPEGNKILDIGGNDGALLNEFWDWATINVDPNAKGTADVNISELWSTQIAKRFRSEIDIITATNAFAHIDDLHEAVQAVAVALKRGGYFIIQVPWLRDLLKFNYYDTIYHEHLSYFTIHSLRRLFQQHWMDIKHVDYLPDIHGGTLRVWAGHGNDNVDNSVAELAAMEDEIDKIDFPRQFVEHRRKLSDLLPKQFWLYGASAKGIMLVNLCGLQDRLIGVMDDTKEKVGKYLPGTESFIVKSDTVPMMACTKTTVLVGAWNYLDRVKDKLRSIGWKGKIVVPFPEPRMEKL